MHILVKAVTIDEGEALAREYKMAFFETSAFNDINVDEVFMRISKESFQRLESAPVQTGPGATKATAFTSTGANNNNNTKAISSAHFKEPAKKSSWCLLL